MNRKLLSISIFLILAIVCQSNAKSIGSDVETSKFTNEIISLSKRESDKSSEESEESKSSADDQVSDGEDSDSENKQEETKNNETSTKDEKSEKKIGCPCKNCPKKNSSSQNSAETETQDEKSVNKSGCPCKSSKNSESKCPCKNCPKKGCPFFKGILNRTQDPIASVASEFVKVLKNALNGTNPSGNINIIVAIAGSGGSVQINAADANVTSLGNARVNVVQIDQVQQANSSNVDEKIEIEDVQLTTQESVIVAEATEVPNVSEFVEVSVASEDAASEQIESSKTSDGPAKEETTIA